MEEEAKPIAELDEVSLFRENRELKKEVKRLRMVVAKLEDARIENVGIHERPALFTAVGEIYQQRLDDLRSEKLEEEETEHGCILSEKWRTM